MASKLKTKLQTLTGVTTAELTAIIVIISGVLLSLILRYTDTNNRISPSTDKYLAQTIFQSLDSLADAERTTYIGTDLANNPDEELAKADTVVEKQVFLGSQLPSRKDEFSGVVNLNKASKVQLMKIPGVGEKTALAIIEYRNNKPFYSIDEIKNIKGIGDKKFEKMRKNIAVD